MDPLLRSALPLSVNLNRYATKVATHIEDLWDACDTARGLLCTKETCKRWTGWKSLYEMVFQTLEDAREDLVSTFSHVLQWKMSVTWQGTQGADVERRGYKGTYIKRKYDYSTNLQNQKRITLEMSVQIINIWIDRKVIYRLTKFY